MTVSRQLFDMPDSIARLPIDPRGYPIPAFANVDDNGVADFRVIKPRWREICHTQKRCWICGGGMGSRKWFVLGPMCSVTRSTMEPPNHKLCAEFAAKNCPFLAMPMAKRNERGLPEEKHVAGKMIDRNPGVCVIWETRSYRPFDAGNGWLIEVGPPDNVTAWRHGRQATREELSESVRTGVPLLMEEALKQGQWGVNGLNEQLEKWTFNVLDKWFPEQVTKGRQAQ